MSNEAEVQWGRVIRRCDAALQAAEMELGAVKMRIPCEETKIHIVGIDTSRNARASAAIHAQDTIERVHQGKNIAAADTSALQGRLRKRTKLDELSEKSLGGWKQIPSVISLRDGKSKDGKVEVMHQVRCSMLNGAVLMLVKVDDGLGAPSYRPGIAYLDHVPESRIPLDAEGLPVNPEHRAAFDRWWAKTIELQDSYRADEPGFAEVADRTLESAMGDANLARQFADADEIPGGGRYERWSTETQREDAAPSRTRTSSE
jgi:hypothetical protein